MYTSAENETPITVMPHVRDCLECGTPFTPKDPRQRYCQRTCTVKSCVRKWRFKTGRWNGKVSQIRALRHMIDCPACLLAYWDATHPTRFPARDFILERLLEQALLKGELCQPQDDSMSASSVKQLSAIPSSSVPNVPEH